MLSQLDRGSEPRSPPEGLAGKSAPTWNRTRNSAFAWPRDVPFTIEASVPRPGVEPGPAPSEGAMMSLSPPGQQTSDQGGTRTLTPRDGHGLLRTACLPFHHLAACEQWTVEGVEPSFAGCEPTVFPLDDTPSQCVGQELNLHSDCGWVTATWARQCPADTSCQYPGWDLNPRSSP